MSLTETCVAVAILVTIIAVATPSLVRAQDIYVLQAAARMLETHMQAARISAVTRNRDCRIHVTSTTSYSVECQSAAWDTVADITLPRGVTISANAQPEFHQRGNVAPTATLTLSNSSGRSLRVIVNINGRVRIQ